MSGHGQLPAGACGRGAALHGLCLRRRDHTDTSLCSPAQPQEAWKEEHRFFIHPQTGYPLQVCSIPTKNMGMGQSSPWQGSGGAVPVLLGAGVALCG